MTQAVRMRTSDVREFLERQGFVRVLDARVLDVPFERTTWTKGNVEVDIDEDTEWLYLDRLGRAWMTQDGGMALFIEMVRWADVRNLIETIQAPSE
ncbi:MAG: hypothetical protein NTZ05_08680 [Chloroflexi bacterium]|nr:hypothetical protein [Chloroflexota bacterium]